MELCALIHNVLMHPILASYLTRISSPHYTLALALPSTSKEKVVSTWDCISNIVHKLMNILHTAKGRIWMKASSHGKTCSQVFAQWSRVEYSLTMLAPRVCQQIPSPGSTQDYAKVRSCRRSVIFKRFIKSLCCDLRSLSSCLMRSVFCLTSSFLRWRRAVDDANSSATSVSNRW